MASVRLVSMNSNWSARSKNEDERRERGAEKYRDRDSKDKGKGIKDEGGKKRIRSTVQLRLDSFQSFKTFYRQHARSMVQRFKRSTSG